MDARKVGRPLKSETDRRQQIGVRTSPSLKARLEQISAANGRSVAQEAELRLVQSFEADDLMGGPDRRSLLIQLASEIGRAEAATGSSRGVDLATHIAAMKLIEAAMVRATPTLADFERISTLERQIERKQQQCSQLRQALAQFNVFSRSAFSTLLGSGDGYLAVEDESRWINPDEPTAPLSNENLAALRKRREDLAGLEADLSILNKEYAIASAPVMDAIRRGRELSGDILSGSGVGGSNGTAL